MPKAQGYRAIAADLRAAIERGEYPAGSNLPTQSELAADYGVRRETIQRAVKVLMAEGLIESATARGTYVLPSPIQLALTRYAAVRDPGRERNNLGPWETACADQGVRGDSELVGFYREQSDAKMAERLGVPAGTPLIHRARRTWADERIAQLTDAWMPADLVEGTPLAEPRKVVGGVYAAMVIAGLDPTTVTETVAVRLPTEIERKRLELGEGTPVMEVWRTTRDAADRVLEVQRLVSNGRMVRLVYSDLPLREGTT